MKVKFRALILIDEVTEKRNYAIAIGRIHCPIPLYLFYLINQLVLLKSVLKTSAYNCYYHLEVTCVCYVYLFNRCFE